VSVTAIRSLVPRRRATVTGEVRSVTSSRRPYVRSEAELDDRRGAIVLRFLGRSLVPGFVPSLHMVATGTQGTERGELVRLNPLYCLAPAE
jgi:hypothetical protein